MRKVCKECGREFVGARQARFCSAACRAKDFRAREKQAAIEAALKGAKIETFEPELQIFEDIRKLAGSETVTDYEKFMLIRNVAKYAYSFVPEMPSRWWFCDRCKTRIQADFPTPLSCPCGRLATWSILNTKP